MVVAKTRGSGYEAVGQSEDAAGDGDGHGRMSQPMPVPQFIAQPRQKWGIFIVSFLISLAICLGLGLVTGDGSLFGIHRATPWNPRTSDADCPGKGPDPPQYFKTRPQLWAGPTATGKPPFMAQNRIPNATVSFIPNTPLQTAIPIEGMGPQNESIFKLMGHLTPYTPSPGFGVNEYPLPAGAEIVQLQMLSRHGARYPTVGSNVAEFGRRIATAAGKFHAEKSLAFLNEWKYELGYEILVPKGRQEMYESGVLHNYMYSQLYDSKSKIIARTTDRMLKSAENFMAGFFGLEWTKNVTIEVIIEEANFNNSLAGYLNCPNGQRHGAGSNAARSWTEVYLNNATARLGGMIEGYNWTIDDTFAAQTLCPYETVSYGFSRFCDLFTYEEWVGFGYRIDLDFYGDTSFGSPVGRAIGIGFQQEVIARLENHTLEYSGSQINVTLDNNTETFPLNQSLYFDFSHDTNIASVLTAFGLEQFKGFLNPSQHPGPHNFTVAHLTPFGARLDIEIIRSPKPVEADRSGFVETGGETKYVHFVLNQRTVPLGWSLPECDATRVDGWCELGIFLKVQEEMPGKANYLQACFGEYEVGPYGSVKDGAHV